MASKYYTFEGMLKWVKVYKPDPKYDNYTVDVYLDDKSWEKFNESGLTLKPQENEEGRFVRFRRPNKKLIKDEVVNFGPPDVVCSENVLIGNGSWGFVDVVVYNTVKGLGHRLNKVTVTKLIPYEPNNSGMPMPPEQQAANIAAQNPPPVGKKRPF